MITFTANPKDIKHDWIIIDATDRILGRLATELARRLLGKDKVEYTPHVNTGDCIIVLNAKKVLLSGNKQLHKKYFYHTNYTGGIKHISFKDMMTNQPERIIKIAVKGMLPRGPLGKNILRNLKIYAGNNHNHQAQKPKILKI